MEIRNPDYHVGMAQYWHEKALTAYTELFAQSCRKMMRKHYMAAQWSRQRDLLRSN